MDNHPNLSINLDHTLILLCMLHGILSMGYVVLTNISFSQSSLLKKVRRNELALPLNFRCYHRPFLLCVRSWSDDVVEDGNKTESMKVGLKI